MARPIWTGVISFGLVSVPVKMYSATSEHEVSFHQFEKGTSDRIRYQRVNERTGTEVDYGDIVKGADVGGGKYAVGKKTRAAKKAPVGKKTRAAKKTPAKKAPARNTQARSRAA